MSVHSLFSDADLAAIKEAAAEAELRTAGEIVPYVVDRSDAYPEAPLRGALAGAVLGLAAGWAWLRWQAPWGFDAFWTVALAVSAGAAAASGLVRFVPPLLRAVAGRKTIALRTERRAAQAFLEEEVFATRDRTGILLFVSHFEHRVVVVGDSGIHAAVASESWQRIAADMAAGIKRGEALQAMIRGIAACGALLEEAGVARRADDVDELANDVRLRDA